MRCEQGGRIDRTRTLSFRFNGRALTGHAGDTLASALVANGVGVVGRSFKFHRPRGIMAAGVEEPNAIVDLGRGTRYTPNSIATRVELFDGLEARSVNCWPSANFDFGAIASLFSSLMPAGFAYKTFMWPASLWTSYEKYIRIAAGLGRSPVEADADRYEKRWAHTDVAVVGGGPAGLAAALSAARSGARVLLVEDDSEMGGALLSRKVEIDGRPAMDWVAETVAELAGIDDAILLTRTTAFGYYDHNYLIFSERVTDHLGADAPSNAPRHRLWKVRARQVVLATGALERPLVFAGNDRPGVMLASGAQSYANRFAALSGRRAVVFTNNDTAYGAALDLADTGVAVGAVVDLRPDSASPAVEAARARGIEVLSGHAVVATRGRKRLRGVEVAALATVAGGQIDEGAGVRTLDCDLLACSGGWNPTVHLFSQAGGKLRFDPNLAAFVPKESARAPQVAGAARGTFALDQVLADGFAAGAEAARAAGFAGSEASPALAATPSENPAPLALWRIPARRRGAKRFVDITNDVTDSDIALSAREGYTSVEHAKRYTMTGMGVDQGRTGNVLALAILAEERGDPIEAVGTTTFRPPYTPVPFGVIAGRDTGKLVMPEAKTPLSPWLVEQGAVLEAGGRWSFPSRFPREGEDMEATVKRECLAVRNGVGLANSSTLGKLDIQGRDSLELLNMVYTNAWDSLEIGRVRFGVMLAEDGSILDDGVTARLEANHYHMCPSTGGVETVLDWLEQLLQCEWPHWDVYVTDVSAQWASITLAGPKARRVLANVGTDINLTPAAFPHMSLRQGQVAGVPARILRVSFTGEICFEVNVQAGYGRAVCEALMAAGEPEGIMPVGGDALDILRTEKGYILPGQDTDTDTTPHDLGMAWILSRKKSDYIGKRSLERPFFHQGRKQLVGLLTENPDEVIPLGCHIVPGPRAIPHGSPHMGFVTSSCYSHTLDRSIALAVLEEGRERIGDTVELSLGDKTTRAQVTQPRFYDPEGARLHG